MELRWPALDMLDSYAAALRTGWSPNTVRPAAAGEELEHLGREPVTFVKSLVDRDGTGPPFLQPDGTLVPRVPGYRKWMWDGEFAGTIGFRWQPGTNELPPHVTGHIGYSVVPWKRRLGYASAAVAAILDDARAEGLTQVQITCDETNRASQGVITKNGGVLAERFDDGLFHDITLRFVIDL